jgi:hypothetical protein
MAGARSAGVAGGGMVPAQWWGRDTWAGGGGGGQARRTIGVEGGIVGSEGGGKVWTPSLPS